MIRKELPLIDPVKINLDLVGSSLKPFLKKSKAKVEKVSESENEEDSEAEIEPILSSQSEEEIAEPVV